jgi:hypothetical protein
VKGGSVAEALNGKLVDWMEKLSEEQYGESDQLPGRKRPTSNAQHRTSNSESGSLRREKRGVVAENLIINRTEENKENKARPILRLLRCLL